jgi:hypothetical protein
MTDADDRSRPTMTPKRIETVAWVLIYSGLLVLCLGLFLQRSSAVLGWVLVAAGALDAAAGVVMIWWRSRLKP